MIRPMSPVCRRIYAGGEPGAIIALPFPRPRCAASSFTARSPPASRAQPGNAPTEPAPPGGQPPGNGHRLEQFCPAVTAAGQNSVADDPTGTRR